MLFSKIKEFFQYQKNKDINKRSLKFVGNATVESVAVNNRDGITQFDVYVSTTDKCIIAYSNVVLINTVQAGDVVQIFMDQHGFFYIKAVASKEQMPLI